MRYGFFFLLTTALLTSRSFADEKEITEQIRGKIAASQSTAGANYKTRCEEWEQTLRGEAGNAVLYASCGADSVVSFATRSATTECYTKVTENGQTYQECGEEWRDNTPYGFANLSTGKVLLTVSESINELNDQVGGEKFSCETKDGKGCLAAREKAFATFEAKCVAFRAKAKSSFGARYIYATCGDPKNTTNSQSLTEFQYVAKASIYYRK